MRSSQKHKTIGLRKVILVFVLLASILGGQIYLINNLEEEAQAAYPYGCVTQACREAADRASASEARAKELATYANTLEGVVARLNAEIVALEDEIARNQAIANDLNEQIVLNTEKLNLQQVALAKMLVEMYHEPETDALTMLASSHSLSDFAEKQSRQNNAQTQVTLSAKAIRTLKEDLEKQKTSVDALIASTEISRNEVAARRNEQAALIARYKDDSAAYQRDSEEARQIMQQEIAAEIAKYNSGGVVGEGYNSYPWANQCPRSNLAFITVGGYVCQCTSYAGWKVQERWGYTISSWGNAYSWGNSATRAGFVVNNTPAPHTVAFSTAGEWGHVMWVESVNANGTINLSEYNNYYSSLSGSIADFGARYNVNPYQYQYIHFDQKLW